MLTESAVVIEYESGRAKVKCQSQSACGACAAKPACGNSALSELVGSGARGEHIFTIETITPLKIGQRVEIGLSERSLIKSALLMYCVPLFTLLFSTLLFDSLFAHELVSVFFIFISTALSFLGVRWYAQKLNRQSAYQPVLLRVL
ncbi:SoxR reducing system RseC family protein [Aggregatibacter actinomycetemcomitans]|uniref:SoxR reducing system RseC family protein n=1 Tax=Aggregatibacter actinomycetemcomitans TaxID=714 RepID=UPI000D6E61A7|nr:SoxR reducing system RseC family protein [Aggregatibacter actinomycetemcomitans]